MDDFLQQTVNAISSGAIFALFALGYALVFSVLGVLNLAHSALFMWGAFITLIVTDIWGWSILIAFPMAMIGSGLISVALEFVAFRPLRRRNAARIAQLISSIGAALLLVNLAQLLFIELYSDVQGFMPQDLIPNDPIVIEQPALRLSPVRIMILVLSLVVMISLNYMVQNTVLGQRMRAVAFKQDTAALLGINVGQVFWLTFFLAGMLAGAAGTFYALVFGTINPFVYVLFFYWYPIKDNNAVLLLIAFALGITIDVFSDSMALHTLTCVTLAYFRPFIMRFCFGVNFDFQNFTFKNATTIQRLTFLLLLILSTGF